MRIHFIAIGGAVMHNLAIALHKKGNIISGSDDEIFEPSLRRLQKNGLLPKQWGWFPGRINSQLDAVILGMHASEDNPELKQAKKLGLKIYSFPEYLYEQTKNKKRVVIAGSHGKTTITSMIMHALRQNGVKFDYMVGSILEGFETMVEISDKNKIAIFEGDEYLTSTIDKRPKFHLYMPHIGLISGIAWDHINVFPTFENYVDQFKKFATLTSEAIVYYEGDPIVNDIASAEQNRLKIYPYLELFACVNNEMSIITHDNLTVSLNIFGKYNMQNLAGAMQVCKLLGISEHDFLKSMVNFRGAAKRQELLARSSTCEVYLDFAHAPSKVKATVEAFRTQFPERQFTTCLELHTFSSLTAGFLPHYKDSLEKADRAIVYYNPEVVAHKKLPEIKPKQILQAFGRKDLIVINDKSQIEALLMENKTKNQLLLIMTSGNFSGLDLKAVAKKFIENCS